MFVLIIFLICLSSLIYLIILGNATASKNNKLYSSFVRTLNNKNFIVYTNKEKSHKYIETEILPFIKNTEVIFLKGKTIVSNYENQHISKMLYGIDVNGGFPYLLKIRNNTIFEKSINNELFNVINQEKDPSKLLNDIADFYNS